MTTGNKNKKDVSEELTWPESCHYYKGSEYVMGHKEHKCAHPCGKNGRCIPGYCPLNKLEKLSVELEECEEKYSSGLIEEDELGWYEDQIKWLNGEINKIMNEVVQ